MTTLQAAKQPDQVFEPGGLPQYEPCLTLDPPDKVRFSRVEPRFSDAEVTARAAQRLEEMATFGEDASLVQWNLNE